MMKYIVEGWWMLIILWIGFVWLILAFLRGSGKTFNRKDNEIK